MKLKEIKEKLLKENFFLYSDWSFQNNGKLKKVEEPFKKEVLGFIIEKSFNEGLKFARKQKN